ncbi:MAG TPA: TetR/AcrR family transcriptional regulator [Alphaproteobacteria bacterium]|nr:TetR/AcrR family transcriptional regulator [Alphaproteobacteria bacterium]
MTHAPQTASRREAVRDFKRQRILEGAKRVFQDKGLDGAAMRAIAAEAGYTAGALYSYYPTKEDIYAAILADSLAALAHAIRDAVAGDAAGRARTAAQAFYDYYRAHPLELDLSFYLYRGIGPRGLTPAVDRQLNGRLIAALKPIADAFAALGGLDPAQAGTETVAAACHMSGVLLLERSGRLKVLDQSGPALVARHLDELTARLTRRP